MQTNIIQIAGVKNETEVRLLLEKGVNFIGYPLRLAVNQEDICEEEARHIIENTRSAAQSVLITYLDRAKEVMDICDFLRVKIVQLHGEIPISEMKKIKQCRPDIQIIKSLVVGKYSLDELERLLHYSYPFVDYYITDTYNPMTGAEGATGLVHDWQISREIVRVSPRPVILAGGLNPPNVIDAIKLVRPAGVDVHTGVEDAQGNKQKDLVEEFVNHARCAFQELIDLPPETFSLGDTLDLHTFQPREVKNLVHDFISDCLEKGITEVRFIHGKGKGVLRDIVHSELEKDKRVLTYKLAHDRFSSWGATVAVLVK
ncbi:MAG: Smr/MutS family protein [Candidatus Marinimicrobia bacterium]|nr:Smr/MutS family protein [Candidatus Neomarinimicrobiota bacterium]